MVLHSGLPIEESNFNI